MKLLDKVKAFLADWWSRLKSAIHFRSIQLAILAGGIGGYFQTYPDQYQGLLGMIPEWVRPFAGIALFGILPLIARLVKQDTPSSS